MAAAVPGAPVPGAVFDVVVVGAGIMGSCAAYECAKRGLRVALLEQFDFLHRKGSSHGESRIIRRTYPEDWYTEMMPRAYALWHAAAEEAGYSPLTTTGSLDFGPADNVDLKELLRACQKHGVPHEVLTRGQLRGRFPAFDVPEGTVGVYCAEGGIVHATKACAMFQQLAAKRGAVLVGRAKVLAVGPVPRGADVHIHPDGTAPTTSTTEMASRDLNQSTVDGESASAGGEGRREQGGAPTISVETSRGPLLCSACVLACGPWTAQLVKSATGVSLPVQPLQTHVAYWRAKPEWLSSLDGAKGSPVFISYDEPYVYGMPILEYPGLVKISLHGGTPCDPDKRPLGSVAQSVVAPLQQWIRAKLPEAVDATEAAFVESCMYSMTPDQDFILDVIPLEPGSRDSEDEASGPLQLGPGTGASPCRVQARLVVVAGFSGHGFKFGPLIGKIAADLAQSGESKDAPMELFSMRRFEENRKGNPRSSRPQVRGHFDEA